MVDSIDHSVWQSLEDIHWPRYQIEHKQEILYSLVLGRFRSRHDIGRPIRN